MKILVEANFVNDNQPNISFGGRPLVYNTTDYEWPKCSNCKEYMQYLGKMFFEKNSKSYFAFIFMCGGDDPCLTWEAYSGANKVVKLAFDNNLKLRYLDLPENVEIERLIRPIQYGCDIVNLDEFDDYEEACASIRSFLNSDEFTGELGDGYIKPIKPSYQSYQKESQFIKPFVLGQLYGEPYWLQGDDEIPLCRNCNKNKDFLAFLEEGPDDTEYNGRINFGGGGIAYIFDCQCNDMSMIWQS